jgi:RPA family protein
MIDEKIKRWIAVKTDISTLFNSKFVEDDSDLPSYILTEKEEKIYRVNLMVIVLDFNTTGNITNVLVDDGSGKIDLRFFEENKILDKINVGSSLLVIGRLRIYNNEKYLSPEIVKIIDPAWLKVRSLELEKRDVNNIIKISENTENSISNNDDDIENNIKEKNNIDKKFESEKIEEENKISDKVEEIFDEKTDNEIDNELLPSEKIIQLIKELDEGKGALIEDIIDKSKIENAEQIINIMIKNGEIFQNMPGKVKVL